MPTVVVVGGGGREHALVHALAASQCEPRVVAAPGNGGTPNRAAVDVSDIDGLCALAAAEAADLVVVGPEAPLVQGLADRLRADGFAVLGPSRDAARLEGSKAFSKTVMDEANVPTARWGSFTDAREAEAFARTLARVVVKADGLAGGKGVVVCETHDEAERAIDAHLSGRHGSASRSIVVEERLEGEELSVIALADGSRVALLAPSQDHKRVFDGDRGPNTGGMGAYSPAPHGTPGLMAEVERRCLVPILDRMAERGTPFTGVLYAGLMMTADGPKVLEYNVRFGDPEAQAILPRMEDDVYEVLLATARGELGGDPVRFSDRAALTVVLAAEGYPGDVRTGDRIEGLAEAEAVEDVVVCHAGTRREGDRLWTAGGRVLSVTGLGKDLMRASDAAYAAAGRLFWPGLHYRRDIGFRALGPVQQQLHHDLQ